MVTYILMAIIGYLIGSVNFGILISKKFAGFDVREKGSGNAGTTNVLRSVGKKAAAATLICDILKGVVSVIIALILGKIMKSLNPAILIEVAALGVVIGHTFPIYFGFKGGKGVATSLGILLIINWKIGLICLIYGIFIIAVTRMVSLGSILSAILFAVLTVFIRDSYLVPFSGSYIIFAILLAAFVIFNHRSNLKRINAGTENRISFKKKDKEEKKEEPSVEAPIEIKVEEDKSSASNTEVNVNNEEVKENNSNENQ